MRTVTMLLCASLLGNLPMANADTPPTTHPLDDYGVEMRMEVVKLPIFPQSLLNEGYLLGEVKLALDVDHDGELRDWIVTDATHPDFINAVESVIDDWRFSPPYINGENRSVVSHLNVSFSTRSSVISLDTTSFVSARIAEITQYTSERTKLADPDDLDAEPYPISQPKPRIPGDMIQANNGTRATFTFYVDEAGQVRLPSLAQTDGNPDLGVLLAAQDALEQWRFEPPTVKRRPVKVKLSQAFVFKDQ